MSENEFEVKLANVRELMSSRVGKELMWEILSYCDLYTTGANKFQAGKRQVGLDILQLLEDADPEIYPKLLLANIKND